MYCDRFELARPFYAFGNPALSDKNDVLERSRPNDEYSGSIGIRQNDGFERAPCSSRCVDDVVEQNNRGVRRCSGLMLRSKSFGDATTIPCIDA
jgi:hypothetical protein